jgi:methionyl-tRNA formyltransferase
VRAATRTLDAKQYANELDVLARRERGVKVALFASGGDIPTAALRALHPVAEVVVVIRPGPDTAVRTRLRGLARQLLRGARPLDGVSRLAAQLGVPEHWMRGPDDPTLAPHLRHLGVDVSCVATFSWRLRPDVLAAAPRGTINAHASLLPRHRGPSPWFWTYYEDDQEAGVTIHVCDERIDTGPILRQERWPLARGYPVAALHEDVARRGAELLAEVLAAMDHEEVRPVPQDAALATRARRVLPGTPMIDSAWPAERTWHFLAGLVGQYAEPLRCDGAPVAYTRVPGYARAEPGAAPGTVEPDGPLAWRLWCRDGFIRLERDAG